MKSYRRHWYNIGLIIFIILAFFMGFFGDQIDPLRTILIFSFMALLVHQFEELAIPGGFPALFNIVMFNEKDAPERYPLNANTNLIINVYIAYTFYISAIIFPNIMWLAIAQIFFGMAQIISHAIVFNVRLKTFYNPGLGAVVFLHWPIGVYFIWYVTSNGLATPIDFVIGAIATVAITGLGVALPNNKLAKRDSEFPFEEEEVYGYAHKFIRKLIEK